MMQEVKRKHKAGVQQDAKLADRLFGPVNSYHYLYYLGEAEALEYCKSDEAREAFLEKLATFKERAHQAFVEEKEGWQRIESDHKANQEKWRLEAEEAEKKYQNKLELHRKKQEALTEEAKRATKKAKNGVRLNRGTKAGLLIAVLLVLAGWLVFSAYIGVTQHYDMHDLPTFLGILLAVQTIVSVFGLAILSELIMGLA